MKAFPTPYIPIQSDFPRTSQDSPPELVAPIQSLVPGYAQLPYGVIVDDILLIRDEIPSHPVKRLVVLVPPGEFDETALARRVWQLSASSIFKVLYIGLSPDVTQTALQRSRLARLAAMTSGQNIRARASLRSENYWSQALEHILQPEDMLVCLASHLVSEHLIWRRKLGEQLVETLGVPVYLFGGLKIFPAPQEWQSTREILAWLASLSLLAVFFAAQVYIDRASVRPLSTILHVLSIVVGMYLLLKVNEWIG